MKLFRMLFPPAVFLVAGAMVVAGAAQPQTIRASLQPSADRQPAPSIRLDDSRGKRVALSDFRGRPLVLNLWATDCGGCRAELPTFVQLRRTYPENTLAVVGLSLDVMYEDLKSAAEGWARVKPFAKAHDMTYSILLDDGSAGKAFHVTALPATYLIDRAGRLAATYIGVVDPADLEANIKLLLAER